MILGKAIIEITLPDGVCPPPHLEGCTINQNSTTWRFRWEYLPLFGEVSKDTEGKSWRPPDWEPSKPIGFATATMRGWVELITDPKMLAMYELGADAMLKALRKLESVMMFDTGVSISYRVHEGLYQSAGKGKMVFIPDDRQEEV